MAVIYIENPNGNHLSYDKTKRYETITGEAAYNYLQTEEAKSKRFMKLNDSEDADLILMEITDPSISTCSIESNHERYLSKCKRNNPLTILSFSLLEEAEENHGLMSGECIIPDDTYSPEVHHIELDRLQELYHTLDKAFASLTDTEFDILKALYLRRERASAREYAREKGIPQRTLNDQKNKALKKIKKFL